MIALPDDRTLKSPSVGFCRNPQCRERSDQEFRFAIEHDCVCPKCGANREPMVGVLVLTHALVPDKKGPVMGQGGSRWKIACESKRAYLATATNLEAATNNQDLVTCAACKKALAGKTTTTIDETLGEILCPANS